MDAYTVVRRVLGAPVRMLFWVRVEGIEHIPPTGGVLFAANHTSFWDSVVLLAVLPLRLKTKFIAKREHYTGTSWRGRFKARLAGIFALPVQREGEGRSQSNLASIVASDEHVQSGFAVGYHIEGSRTPEGYMFAGQWGAVRQARHRNVPIVPVVILGARDGRPFGPVTIRFGKPIKVNDYAHEEVNQSLRDNEDIVDTRKVAEVIAELGGLFYTDAKVTPTLALVLRENVEFCELVYGRPHAH